MKTLFSSLKKVAEQQLIFKKGWLVLMGAMLFSVYFADAQKANLSFTKLSSNLIARNSGDFTVYHLPGSSDLKLLVAKEPASALLGKVEKNTSTVGTGVKAMVADVPPCIGAPIYPSDGATNICPGGYTVQWPAVPEATGYKVYLSGNPNQNPLPLWGSTSGTSFGQFSTSFGLNVRWKIVPFNAAGDAIGCSTWTFTTGDVTPPVIRCPANKTLVPDASCSAGFGTFSPDYVADACSPKLPQLPQVVQEPKSGILTGVGSSQELVLTAIDVAGNTASCSFTVTLAQSNAVPSVSIRSSASGNTTCAGASVTFTASPTNGGASPVYQWTINGAAQSETGSTLTRNNLSDGDEIKVKMTSSIPCLATSTASSNTITMTVNTISVDAGTCAYVYLGYGSNCTTLSATGSGSAGGLTYSWSPGSQTGASIEVCPSQTTTYTVTAKDRSGCTATDQVVVEVIDLRCGQEMDKVQICHNGLDLCIDAESVADHLAHGDQLGSCGTIPCSGSGRLIGDTSAGFAVKPGNFSSSAANLLLFPNPAHETVTLQLDNAVEGIAKLQILDLAGRVIKMEKREVSAGYDEVTLNIQSLSTGLYFILYTDSKNNQSLIKMSKN